MNQTKEEIWKSLPLDKKINLIWGMRIAPISATFCTRFFSHFSIREWKWRYNAAKSTAYFEAKYDLE